MFGLLVLPCKTKTDYFSFQVIARGRKISIRTFMERTKSVIKERNDSECQDKPILLNLFAVFRLSGT